MKHMVKLILMLGMLLTLSVGAFGVETHKYKCTVSTGVDGKALRTTTGAYIGVYTVDGVVQPGYCTAGSASGWETTGAIVINNPVNPAQFRGVELPALTRSLSQAVRTYDPNCAPPNVRLPNGSCVDAANGGGPVPLPNAQPVRQR